MRPTESAVILRPWLASSAGKMMLFGGFETGLEAFASVPAGTSHDDF